MGRPGGEAGASPAGQLFSARNAEGVYISSPNPAAAHALTSETRALAAANGRDPGAITFAQGLSFVIGDTHREAVRRSDEIKRYLDLEGVARVDHDDRTAVVVVAAIEPAGERGGVDG